jgi:hypothetical protein
MRVSRGMDSGQQGVVGQCHVDLPLRIRKRRHLLAQCMVDGQRT